jgi:hypothetical protein
MSSAYSHRCPVFESFKSSKSRLATVVSLGSCSQSGKNHIGTNHIGTIGSGSEGNLTLHVVTAALYSQ